MAYRMLNPGLAQKGQPFLMGYRHTCMGKEPTLHLSKTKAIRLKDILNVNDSLLYQP